MKKGLSALKMIKKWSKLIISYFLIKFIKQNDFFDINHQKRQKTYKKNWVSVIIQPEFWPNLDFKIVKLSKKLTFLPKNTKKTTLSSKKSHQKCPNLPHNTYNSYHLEMFKFLEGKSRKKIVPASKNIAHVQKLIS